MITPLVAEATEGVAATGQTVHPWSAPLRPVRSSGVSHPHRSNCLYCPRCHTPCYPVKQTSTVCPRYSRATDSPVYSLHPNTVHRGPWDQTRRDSTTRLSFPHPHPSGIDRNVLHR